MPKVTHETKYRMREKEKTTKITHTKYTNKSIIYSFWSFYFLLFFAHFDRSKHISNQQLKYSKNYENNTKKIRTKDPLKNMKKSMAGQHGSTTFWSSVNRVSPRVKHRVNVVERGSDPGHVGGTRGLPTGSNYDWTRVGHGSTSRPCATRTSKTQRIAVLWRGLQTLYTCTSPLLFLLTLAKKI